MEPLNLAAEVRRIAMESGLADPSDIAAKITEQLTTEQCRSALTITLPGYVRLIVTTNSRTVNPPRGNANGRAQRIHAWADNLRATRLLCERGWKIAGECCSDDLRYAAAQREAEAERVRIQATRWYRLAEVMDALGVRTLSELDEDVLRQAWR
jgi:hypothetical protein